LEGYPVKLVPIPRPFRDGARLDVLNLGDAGFEIRNSTGVGVGAPQFGRMILARLT
jgi:hypothetical protein